MQGSPNTRVQRTRSSPSALRSPLTRRPLGRTMGLVGLMFVCLQTALASTRVSNEPLEAWISGVVFIGVGRVTRVAIEPNKRDWCLTGVVEEAWKGSPPESVDLMLPRLQCGSEGDFACLAVGDRFVFLAFSPRRTNSPTVTYVSPMRVFQRLNRERFELLYPVILPPVVLSPESIRESPHDEELGVQVVFLDEFRHAVGVVSRPK
jgi:hypothetical protein